MALIIKAILTDDETGEVVKTYIEAVPSHTHSWEAAQAIRVLLGRVFRAMFGDQNDEW